MSLLPFRIPAETAGPNLLVWNNAAYDDDGDGVLEDQYPASTSSSWWTHCHDSHSSKENLNPPPENSPFATYHPSHIPPVKNTEEESEQDEEKKIEREIEELENEIARLSSRLSALKQQKEQPKTKKAAARTVPPKFIETKEVRRGRSMGPAEIISLSKMKLLNKPEIGILTPSSKMTRKVSCFWRLEEIDELKLIKERGKSASLSPKSRKPWPKAEPSKQAATCGAKKVVKKEMVPMLQPRKLLFGEGEKAATSATKKKAGRIVPSRYNSGEMRKRSLSDETKEEGGKRRLAKGEAEKTKSKCDVTPMVPKIKTLRCISESPRDSGAAKRVAELVGRKSLFADDYEEYADAFMID